VNRIVDSVIIIDSAMGNRLILDSGNRSVNLDHCFVNAIGFYGLNTTAAMALSGADTTSLVWTQDYMQSGTFGGPVVALRFSMFPFATPQKFNDLKVPVLTAATGFLYLA